jgi:hypothetical protein
MPSVGGKNINRLMRSGFWWFDVSCSITCSGAPCVLAQYITGRNTEAGLPYKLHCTIQSECNFWARNCFPLFDWRAIMACRVSLLFLSKFTQERRLLMNEKDLDFSNSVWRGSAQPQCLIQLNNSHRLLSSAYRDPVLLRDKATGALIWPLTSK